MAFKYTEDQLNKMDKALLIELFLGLQDQMEELTKETHALNQKMQLLMEQVVLAKHHRFGRSTERMEDTTQISFMEIDASERAIRGFCIGRKSWQLIDTIRGAENSAIIYSIAETAKANDLKPYEYFEHLLTEIPKHMEDTDRSFLDDLLPWSEKLPKEIKKTNKRS